ncbi:protein disulfide oxidoreductase [Shewanella maritima]|uniref:protein disulfide oxidoreductase n=1 Tax=Shewanella maritima TaxID=2520507 RepID=UPI003736DDA7
MTNKATKLTLKQQLRSGRFWLTQLRDLLILFVILFAISSYLQRDMHRGQAIAINGINIHGQAVHGFNLDKQDKLPLSQTQNPAFSTLSSSDTLQSDRPTLLYFWGTWCAVCRITSPMVNQLHLDDYQVLTIAVASNTDNHIQRYMQENEYQFEVINQDAPDNQPDMSEQWGAFALPAIYIIDDKQQIRYVTQGATSTWGMKIRMWLAANTN